MMLAGHGGLPSGLAPGLTLVCCVPSLPQAIQARQILRQTVSGLIKEARQKSMAGGIGVLSLKTLRDGGTAAPPPCACKHTGLEEWLACTMAPNMRRTQHEALGQWVPGS